MPEGNGNERDARIEKLNQDHEEFRRDLKQLLTAQVIQKSQLDDLLKVTQEQTKQIELGREKDAALDARVDKLVSAIGEFISRLPVR